MLPPSLQIVAGLLPASHVFEGMRAVLIDQTFRGDLLLHAALLNVVYISVGIVVFLAVFRAARRRGLLLNVGE